MTDEEKSAVDTPAGPAWLSRPGSVKPTVLILGGFLTAPPLYQPLVRRLMDRGAAGTVVADVWTPDWLIAGVRGIGPICSRSARALRAAVRLSAEVSAGAPILIVGHSAGGITARLLTAAEPVAGRKLGAAPRIGAIVTLGTPHRLSAGEGIGRRINDVAAARANAVAPGACFAPEIGYVSVASRAVRSNLAGSPRERVAHLLYRSVIGRAAVPGTEGDGLVPVVATELAGARQVLLDRSLHGVSGRRWYGTDDAVEVWWPIALDAWRSALEYRARTASIAAGAEPIPA